MADSETRANATATHRTNLHERHATHPNLSSRSSGIPATSESSWERGDTINEASACTVGPPGCRAHEESRFKMTSHGQIELTHPIKNGVALPRSRQENSGKNEIRFSFSFSYLASKRPPNIRPFLGFRVGSAYGNRTRLSALRGPCPEPIDERAVWAGERVFSTAGMCQHACRNPVGIARQVPAGRGAGYPGHFWPF